MSDRPARRRFVPSLGRLEDRTLQTTLPGRPLAPRPPTLVRVQADPGTETTSTPIVGRPLETAALWNPARRGFDWVPYQPLAEQLRAASLKAKPSVVFLGDSITSLWLPIGTAAWKGQFARYQPANLGIAGDDARALLWRIEQGALDSQPRAAVIQIGINDLRTEKATPDDVVARIRAVVAEARAQAPETRVLVLGLTPTGDPDTNQSVAQVNDALAASARDDGYTFLNLNNRLMLPSGQLRPGTLMDPVHLSAQSYMRIAPWIALQLRRFDAQVAVASRH